MYQPDRRPSEEKPTSHSADHPQCALLDAAETGPALKGSYCGSATDLLYLQRLAGNRAVCKLLAGRLPSGQLPTHAERSAIPRTTDRFSRSPTAPALSSRVVVQREYEAEFGHNPETFLQHNVLSLNIKEGLVKRTPKLGEKLDLFLKAMDALPRHWFVLLPDSGRSTPDLAAYILTPAIEKYVQGLPSAPGVAHLVGDPDLPEVQPEANYIEAGWVPYMRGRTKDFDSDIGHTDVRREEGGEGFNPNFVFTATMNGCAFAVTGSAKKDSFTAWHYQSPDSDSPGQPERFRAEKKPTDWFGAEEYGGGEHSTFYETQNLLWRNKGTWNVVSQVTEQVFENRPGLLVKKEQVRIGGVQSRALVLEGGSEFGYYAKLFAGRAEYALNSVASRAKKLPMSDTDEIDRRKLSELLAAAMLPLHEDVAAFKDVRSMEGLHEALITLKKRKAAAIEALSRIVDEFVALETPRLKTEQGRWVRTASVKALEGRLRSFITNAQILADEYADVKWVDRSITECETAMKTLKAPSEPSEEDVSAKDEGRPMSGPSAFEGARGRPEDAPADAVPPIIDDEGGILPGARGLFRDAYFDDLVSTTAYLTEAEGEVVATELGIHVNVFRGGTPPGYRRYENAGDGNCLLHTLYQARAASRAEPIMDASADDCVRLRLRVAAVLRPGEEENDYVLPLCAAAVMGRITGRDEIGLGPALRRLLDHPSIREAARGYRAPVVASPTKPSTPSSSPASGSHGAKSDAGGDVVEPVRMPSLGAGGPLDGIAALHTGGFHWVMVRREPVTLTSSK